ncbi:hypothetical protein F5B18DRAFT_657499 [Nemania serpens]|nr:hypothetical protein F5B18DRAFT_657499 [Nemania serpens]
MTSLEDLRHLLSIFHPPWKRPREEQDPSCFILNLPVELICLIADSLNSVDLALLTLTCCSLRLIFQEHTNASRLYTLDRLLFLTTRARGLPNKWVCGKCMKLHPIVKYDTPAATHHVSSCPTGWITEYGRPYLGEPRRDIHRKVCIDDHHTQLALKYARLKDRKYDSYFQDLMAPYHNTLYGPTSAIRLQAHYSAYPRIVPGHDGKLRYMLHSTWRYYKGSNNIIALGNIGTQVICSHLDVNSRAGRKRRRGPPWNVLEAAVQEEIETRGDGQERTGVCACCGTDFAVRLTSEHLDIHVWQDYGPEGIPANLKWRTHIIRPFIHGSRHCNRS